MDRGVVIGGVLICASFLLAVALNRSADAPIRPGKAEEPAAVETQCTKGVPQVAATKHSAQSTPKSDANMPGASTVDGPCK